jgi:hypothetical protein
MFIAPEDRIAAIIKSEPLELDGEAYKGQLGGYTEKEIKRICENNPNIKIAENSYQVYCFIEDSITLKIRDQKLLLGKIKEDLAHKIEDETGINLHGYNLELRSNDIKHTYNNHGNDKTEKQRGQRAITAKDILRFVDIVTNYENVIPVPAKGKCLMFLKNINGKAIAITMYASRNKSLTLKTIYISRKKARG